MRILLVEDARLVAEPLAHALSRAGYAVDTARDGVRGLELAASGAYDAVILDIMLPGLDGLSVLARMRRAGSDAPVILLTARGDVRDRVLGLDAGADDYLAKPFHVEELLARVRAVLRRRGAPDPVDRLEALGVSYIPASRELSCGAETVELTPKEGLVLEALLRRAGRTVPRGAVARAAWGPGEDASDTRLEVQVSLLRGKLRAVGAPARVRAVRGIGYLIEGTGDEDGKR